MRKRTKQLTAALAAVVWYGAYAGACYAQIDDSSPNGLGTSSTGDTLWMMLKVVMFLVIIIGIFLVIMKTVAQKSKIFNSSRSIKAIGGLGLGPNKSVQVVQIGSSLFILGVGNDVQLVSKIEDPEEIQYILDHIQPGAGEFKGFPSLGNWLRKISKRQGPPEDLDVTPSFQAVFQEKMQLIANRQKKVEEMIGQDTEAKNDRMIDRS